MLSEQELRVLDTVAHLGPLNGRDWFVHHLRAVFDSLLERGFICPVYTVSDEGEKILAARDALSDQPST